MRLSTLLGRVSNDTGITTLWHADRDIHILLITRLLRMFAYGSSTLILALHLSALGHSDTQIGLFMTLTLLGDVGISLVLTLVADTLGRRRILAFGALSMTFSGLIFATASSYWTLLLAAVVGVISPSGNEIGPFRAVEESTLAQLAAAETRAEVFALYVVSGTLGAAGGSLVAGWMTQALQSRGWNEIGSFRLVFWLYAVVGLLKGGLTLSLSRKCEVVATLAAPAAPAEPVEMSRPREGEREPSSGEQEPFLDGEQQEEEGRQTVDAQPRPPTRPSTKIRWFQLSKKSGLTLAKLCGLFFFDSLASGMVPASLVAYYISRKFGMPEGTLGTIMASAQFVSSLGNIFASSVAKRIGLVRTMVFTHLPSAIFLALLPVPNSLFVTIVLLVARSSLASMDQAPRSAFLSAVVLPEERTAVMGIVNTVKTSSQSAGPLITGVLASDSRFWIAFVVAGSLKAAYDLVMLGMFASTPLEGERHERRVQAAPSDNTEAQFVVDSHDEEEFDDHEPAADGAKLQQEGRHPSVSD